MNKLKYSGTKICTPFLYYSLFTIHFSLFTKNRFAVSIRAKTKPFNTGGCEVRADDPPVSHFSGSCKLPRTFERYPYRSIAPECCALRGNKVLPVKIDHNLQESNPAQSEKARSHALTLSYVQNSCFDRIGAENSLVLKIRFYQDP